MLSQLPPVLWLGGLISINLDSDKIEWTFYELFSVKRRICISHKKVTPCLHLQYTVINLKCSFKAYDLFNITFSNAYFSFFQSDNEWESCLKTWESQIFTSQGRKFFPQLLSFRNTERWTLGQPLSPTWDAKQRNFVYLLQENVLFH